LQVSIIFSCVIDENRYQAKIDDEEEALKRKTGTQQGFNKKGKKMEILTPMSTIYATGKRGDIDMHHQIPAGSNFDQFTAKEGVTITEGGKTKMGPLYTSQNQWSKTEYQSRLVKPH
jgi:hypothetical protein